MGTKITALPPVITPAGTDELAISQDIGGGSRNTYKATLDQIKNYVKNTGGGTGTITDISITSPDGSIEVFGSPVTSSGTVTLNISSVGLDKLDDGGATNGQVLTYNGSTSAWAASAVPKELPQTALSGQVLTFNGSTSTWVASSLSASGFNASLSSNGYTFLPNGVIMQWGTFNYIGGNVSQTVNLPIVFKQAIYFASVSPDGGAVPVEFAIMDWTNTNLSSISVYGNASVECRFFAIGY